MTSQVPTKPSTLPAWLEERIKQHKEEVARLREQFGDPEEALFQFVREHFSPEAFVPDDQPLRDSNGMTWEEDDDSDAW